MTNCHITGCRNLETKCKDCGRTVNTANMNIGNEWISVKDKSPPKDEPFLALTIRGVEIMDWKEDIVGPGWYGFYCPCACCGGHCSDDFNYWMPLPLSPKENHD